MAVYTLGHMNPDTDSIISAIAAADVFNKAQGLDAKPVAQGEVTPESAFVLEKFGLTAPEVKTSVAGDQIILVDTTDLAQLPSDMGEAEVIGVVDHHKLGDVTTAGPLEMWVWPVGCACTVMKSLYDFYGVEVPKDIAGGMMCAILSDTVMFKSPTCTDKDKEAVEALAKIAGVTDAMEVGMEMFKVKSAVDGAPMKDLVYRDYKNFDMSGNKVGVGQLEVISLDMLDKIKEDLYAELQSVKGEEGCHSVFLMLTDIMKEGTELLIVSDDASVVEKAFGVAGDKTVWLDGVMSRKKQVAPNLIKAFEG